MKRKMKILIADDEPLFLQTTGELLRGAGYDCTCVSDGHAAEEALTRERFDLILSDLNMPGNLRLELLRHGRNNWPAIPLIVITGVPSLPSAIESVRLGIADYLLKPVSYPDLLGSIRRVLAETSTAPTRRLLPDSDISQAAEMAPEIVGRSPKIIELHDVIDRISGTSANVLITGESGTGKEVVAREIHRRSPRSAHPFQIIDCTAIPDTLFESVVFGHVKGSFTGAIKDQDGLLGHCQHGTVFFDEIGELPFLLQAKLLRAVQEQTYTPVGQNEPRSFDARIICATNRNLEFDVAAGRFRRDLYYRLAVIHIELPPLRDRGEDVMLLAEHFRKLLSTTPRMTPEFSPEVLARFNEYSWPGNIRELRNVVESALAMARTSWVELSDLPPLLTQAARTVPDQSPVGENATGRVGALEAAEREYLDSLLARNLGNVSKSAHEAGMSRQGLHKLLKKHGISANDYRQRQHQ